MSFPFTTREIEGDPQIPWAALQRGSSQGFPAQGVLQMQFSLQARRIRKPVLRPNRPYVTLPPQSFALVRLGEKARRPTNSCNSACRILARCSDFPSCDSPLTAPFRKYADLIDGSRFDARYLHLESACSRPREWQPTRGAMSAKST